MGHPANDGHARSGGGGDAIDFELVFGIGADVIGGAVADVVEQSGLQFAGDDDEVFAGRDLAAVIAGGLAVAIEVQSVLDVAANAENGDGEPVRIEARELPRRAGGRRRRGP